MYFSFFFKKCKEKKEKRITSYIFDTVFPYNNNDDDDKTFCHMTYPTHGTHIN